MSTAIGGLSKLAPNEQHADNAWQTPAWLVERVHGLFPGGIDLDPCTTPENPVGARRFFTPADDGILQPWLDAKSVFCNPPYGKTIRHWVRKCIDAGHYGIPTALLVPARTDSRWFQEAWNAADDVLFFRGRLSFRGGESCAPFPSALLGFNVSLESLADLGIRSSVARQALTPASPSY